MSRNLYTFAVVSPKLRPSIDALLPGIPDARPAADLLRAHLSDLHPPSIAYYREILDGWDTTHVFSHDSVVRALPACERLRDSIEARAHWWFVPSLSIRTDRRTLAWARSQRRSSPGWYAHVAYVDALAELLRFAVATGCPALVLWRSAGPSWSSDEFVANSR